MERTRIEGKLIEDDWPVAPPIFGAPWEREPVGPFRVQAWHESHAVELVKFEVVDDLDRALGMFNKWCVPPGPGFLAFVLDESYQVIIGVSATTKTLFECRRYAWWGVRAAWAWMEQFSGQDQLDLAVWEATAHGEAT